VLIGKKTPRSRICLVPLRDADVDPERRRAGIENAAAEHIAVYWPPVCITSTLINEPAYRSRKVSTLTATTIAKMNAPRELMIQ
jgi:hypothetical protein